MAFILLGGQPHDDDTGEFVADNEDGNTDFNSSDQKRTSTNDTKSSSAAATSNSPRTGLLRPQRHPFVDSDGIVLPGLYEEPASPLYRACITGDLIQARLLCTPSAASEGAILCRRNMWESHHHVLHLCCKHGNLDIVRLLVEDHKVDVNQRSEEWRGEGYEAARWTPLHYAINGGHAEIVKLLLKNGADVEAPITSDFILERWAMDGLPPLSLSLCDHQANDDRVTAVAMALVEAGANLASINPHTLMNPIHYAAMTGRTTFLRHLFAQPQHQTNLSMALRGRDFLRYDPMLWCIQSGHYPIVSLLLISDPYADLLVHDRDAHDGLWAICRNASHHKNAAGAVLIMMLLVAHGADYRHVIRHVNKSRKFGLADHFICRDAPRWLSTGSSSSGSHTDDERYRLEDEAEQLQRQRQQREARRLANKAAQLARQPANSRAARKAAAKQQQQQQDATTPSLTISTLHPPTTTTTITATAAVAGESKRTSTPPSSSSSSSSSIDGRLDFGTVVARGLQLRDAMIGYIAHTISDGHHQLSVAHTQLLVAPPLCLSPTALPTTTAIPAVATNYDDNRHVLSLPVLSRDVIGVMATYLFGD